MQINNNYSSPNFGMALKISKGAKKALENASLDEIKALQKAGEDLKDTKFYHVSVDENLKCKLQADKNAYFGRFDTNMYGTRYGSEKNSQGLSETARNIIIIHGKRSSSGSGVDLFGIARYENEGKPVFNVWNSGYVLNGIDSLGGLTTAAKILDGVAADKYAEAAKEAAKASKETVQKNVAIGKLLDSFGE